MRTNPRIDKAACRAALLYNMRNIDSVKDKNCLIPMCKEGKCICLDTLQAKLLSPFTGDNPNTITTDLCQTNPAYHIELYKFYYPDKDKLKRELTTLSKKERSPQRFFAIFQSLSIIFLDNATEEIKDRNSELYLAIYGYETSCILNQLFIHIIKTIINQRLQGGSLNSVEKSIKQTFEWLHNLTDNKDKNLNKLVDILEKYDSCILNVDETIESYFCDQFISFRDAIFAMNSKQQGIPLNQDQEYSLKQWELPVYFKQ